MGKRNVTINGPFGTPKIDAGDIAESLGFTPANASKVTLGIKGVGDEDYVVGQYDLTAAKVGLDKVTNKSEEEIIADVKAQVKAADINAVEQLEVADENSQVYVETQEGTVGYGLTADSAEVKHFFDGGEEAPEGHETYKNTNIVTNKPLTDFLKGTDYLAYLKQEISGAEAVVTGVKGSAEEAYRKGEVEITKANIGLDKVENNTNAEIIDTLTKEKIEEKLELEGTIEETFVKVTDYTKEKLEEKLGVTDLATTVAGKLDATKFVAAEIEKALGFDYTADDETGNEDGVSSLKEKIEQIETHIDAINGIDGALDKTYVKVADYTKEKIEEKLGYTDVAKDLTQAVADIAEVKGDYVKGTELTQEKIETLLGFTYLADNDAENPDGVTDLKDKIGQMDAAIAAVDTTIDTKLKGYVKEETVTQSYVEGKLDLHTEYLAEDKTLKAHLQEVDKDITDIKNNYLKTAELDYDKIVAALQFVPENANDKEGTITLTAEGWTENTDGTGWKYELNASDFGEEVSLDYTRGITLNFATTLTTTLGEAQAFANAILSGVEYTAKANAEDADTTSDTKVTILALGDKPSVALKFNYVIEY